MNLSDKKNTNIITGLIILLAAAAGIYFRLKGLGKWPFAVDEYYFVQSVENILKYGVPRYESGGYYGRGLLQQYITAMLFIIGLKAEFGARILPVFFNLLAIPGLYLLMKKISGKVTAAVLVAVFCFSVWEVEFARFARMYAFFQTIFIWYLYFLYRSIIEDDHKSVKWLWLLSFISIFVYEGSIFLVGLNFLPIFWDKEKQTINLFLFKEYKRKTVSLIVSLVLLVIAYELLTFDFRFLNNTNTLPPDVAEYYELQNPSGFFRTPVLLISTLFSSSLWTVLFVILLSINVLIFSRILKADISIITKAALFLLFVLSILNLLGLIIISFILFMLIGWLEPKDIIQTQDQRTGKRKITPTKVSTSLLLAFSVNFIFWIGFTLKTTAWHKFFPNQTISGPLPAIKAVIKESINYPNLYESFVLFRDVIPVITIIALVLLTSLTIYIFVNYYKEDSKKFRFLLFILVTLIFGVSLINLLFFTTRYFFFLYPLVLMLGIISLKVTTESLFPNMKILRPLTYSTLVIILLISSEDFHLNHLFNIDKREVNFRNQMSSAEKSHYYPRWDMRTPAQIVNKYAKPSDVVISNEQVNDYYLKELDYIYVDYRGRLNGVSVDHGKRELWTNANLIYNDKDFLNLIAKNTNTKWLIINKERGIGFLEDNNFFQKYKKYSIYANPDSSAIVYKIPAVIGEENHDNNSGNDNIETVKVNQ